MPGAESHAFAPAASGQLKEGRTMRITRKLTGALAVALALTTAGCGDEDTAGPGGNAVLLQDAWVATVWRYTNQANSSQQEELVASGVTVTLTIGASTYSILFTMPGQPNQTISGTYTVSGNNFVITETGASSPETIPFTFSNGNNTLSMTSSDSDWDFDGDGTDEPATLTMTFTRQ
jgi:hypothetical protein